MQSTSPIWKWLWNEGGKNLPPSEYEGDIVSFDNPGYTYPKDITIGIEPVQSGSGDPSPTNVRPISGWTGARVTRCGKNLFDAEAVLSGRADLYTPNDDGSITVEKSDSNAWAILQAVPIKKGTYTFSRTTVNGTCSIRFGYENYSVDHLSYGSRMTFTVPEDTFYKIKLGYYAKSYPFTAYYQIESGSPPSDFAPYTGTTYDITFPTEAGTVYGGTLDVTTGLLTVTMAEVDLGTLNWKRNGDNFQFYSDVIAAVSDVRGKNVVCSGYASGNAYSGSSNFTICIYESNPRVFVTDDRFTDGASLKAAMSGVQLVYELATPQTYQLTPTEVKLMLGENNVWVDTGDMTVALVSAGYTRLEARAVIGGVAYTDISAPVIRRAAMQGSLGIGNVVSASLSLVVRNAVNIPRSAKVTVQARLKDGQTASEWLPQGTFFISRRARDPVTGLLALECYDALLKANALWEPSAGTWPRTMAAVAAELAALLGLEIDSRTTLPEGAAFVISEPPAGTTVRDVLGVIAQAGGGNWIVTPLNRLRLLPVGGGTDAVDVTGVTGGMRAGTAGTVTGVRCTVDGLQTLIGDDTGIVVDATVAPVIAADMAEGLIGQAYQPFSLTGAIYDPAAELGDAVRAGVNGEVASVLYSETAALGPAFRGDIEAPEAGEIADEYPYIGSGEKVLALAKAAVNEAVDRLDDDLTQQEIFNRLTDNGAAQGLVLYDGQLYINASYINAGMLNARFINFNAPVDDFAVPNENDPDTLLDGQTVTGGWIVNESGSREIVALECDYAKLLRGRTITLKFTFNDELSYCEYYWDSLDGPSGTGVVEPVSPANPYTYYFTVPDEADSFRLVMTCDGLKQIDATVSGSQIVYPDDIRFTYAGLQIGKFLVDRSGNLFGKGQNQFDGTAWFNGNVYFRNPSAVRTNIGAMPADPPSIELNPPVGSGFGGYIDFHFNGSSEDYTTRLIEAASGQLTLLGSLIMSSPLGVPSGGTGATDADGARANIHAMRNPDAGTPSYATGNLNDAPVGFSAWYGNQNTVNHPFQGWATVLTMNFTVGYVQQIAFSWFGNQIAYRVCDNGTWYAWKYITLS